MLDSLKVFVPITPSDITPGIGTENAVALFVGGAGTVTFRTKVMEGFVTVTLPAGMYPINVVQVMATGTTATGLVAAY